jgi:hypothetical protein
MGASIGGVAASMLVAYFLHHTEKGDALLGSDLGLILVWLGAKILMPSKERA